MIEVVRLVGFLGVNFFDELIVVVYKIECIFLKDMIMFIVDIGGGIIDICCIKLFFKWIN